MSDSCSCQVTLSPREVSRGRRASGDPGDLGSAWTGSVTDWRLSVRSEGTSEEELEEVPRVPGSDFVFAEQS